MGKRTMDYVKTGVHGVDAILGGGVVKDSTVLVGGSPGTGKSLSGIQYLYNGLREYDEEGIYLSFQQTRDDLE